MTGINEYRATARFNLAVPALLNTVLLSKPPKTTKSKTAIFYWGAKNKGTNSCQSFKSQCKLDKAKAWTSLQAGQDVHEAQAGHAHLPRAGRQRGVWDKTPAAYTWKVKK